MAGVLIAFVLLAVQQSHAGGSGAPTAGRPDAAHRPIIVFLSDFGTVDDAVAICKGVMLSIAPQADIVDLTHQVTPYSVADGARFLARAAPYYPRGTVFIGVVDPGVGTERRPIIVKTRRGQYFVAPDNGLLAPLIVRDGLEGAREIRNPAWQLAGSTSATFHGRDIFSPAAAHLARGEDWRAAGPLIEHLAQLDLPVVRIDAEGIRGQVAGLDGPFGNLVTNVTGEEFRELGYGKADRVRVRVGSEELTVPYAGTFGDVAAGEPLLFIDSRGLVSLAINRGNFAASHHVEPPVDLLIRRK